MVEREFCTICYKFYTDLQQAQVTWNPATIMRRLFCVVTNSSYPGSSLTALRYAVVTGSTSSGTLYILHFVFVILSSSQSGFVLQF
jgi:hypothetical protein